MQDSHGTSPNESDPREEFTVVAFDLRDHSVVSVPSLCLMPEIDQPALHAALWRKPQQIEADLIKTAVIRLHRIFKRWKPGARIVMMIHDSLWVEAPMKEAAQVRHLMKRMIETTGKPHLKALLEVEFG